MSKEIQCIGPTGATGSTALYARVIRATDGQVWNSNSSAFEAYSTASLTSGYYAITMTEAGTASKYYTGDFPSAIGIGLYSIIVKQKASAGCLEADSEIASGQIEWTGTVVNGITNSDTNGRVDVIKIAGGTQAVPGASGGLLISGTNNGSLTITGALTVNEFACATDFYVGGNFDVVGTTGFTGNVTASGTWPLSTRIPAALVGGMMDCNVSAIDTSTSAATKQKKAALVIYEGTVTNTSTNTTVVDSSLSGANNFYVGRIVLFLTGSLALQATNITSYTSSTKTLTVAGLTAAPSISDQFIIV